MISINLKPLYSCVYIYIWYCISTDNWNCTYLGLAMRQTLATILLCREHLRFEPAPPRCFQAAASLWADPPWSARCVLCGRHAWVASSTGRSSRNQKLTPNLSSNYQPMTLKISQVFLSSKPTPIWSFDWFPVSPQLSPGNWNLPRSHETPVWRNWFRICQWADLKTHCRNSE